MLVIHLSELLFRTYVEQMGGLFQKYILHEEKMFFTFKVQNNVIVVH